LNRQLNEAPKQKGSPTRTSIVQKSGSPLRIQKPSLKDYEASEYEKIRNFQSNEK